MSRRLGYLVASVVLGGIAALTACTTLLGDFEVVPGNAEAGSGVVEGAACTVGTECASGFCADGVCCESACGSTCEQCNLPGTAGKCMPVPDGQDPASECPTTPLPTEVDAGVTSVETDGGQLDAGMTFSTPDAGLVAEDNQCAGKCDGNRACKYPAKERTCGSTFCGNGTQQGRASCDGEGHCLVGIEECAAFACADGSPGCKTTCTGEADCLSTHFCDALSSTCKPKLGNGSACTSVAQCGSGNCVSNVCCNDPCNGFPGATCTAQGSVGTCQCSACPGGGACQLYYRDEDGDTFGDKYGTVVNGRAEPGCVKGPAPVGFVANNLDCLDGPDAVAKLVRPNQTAHQSSAYTRPLAAGGGSSFDYNCSGVEEKQVPEFIGASCGFCTGFGFPRACINRPTCSTDKQAAGLRCSGLCNAKACSCRADTSTGFTSAVACGSSGTAVNCGQCTAAGGAVTGTATATAQQKCL